MVYRCVQSYQGIAKIGAGFQFTTIRVGTEAEVTTAGVSYLRLRVSRSNDPLLPIGTELLVFEDKPMWEATATLIGGSRPQPGG